MPPQLYFFLSIVFAFIAWGIVAQRYIWPKLRSLPRADALRPILILHGFRFVGLAFVVTGVVSPDLPSAFAYPTAYGDIAAAHSRCSRWDRCGAGLVSRSRGYSTSGVHSIC